MIKYIIFDKDGTLLDTELIFKRSWVEVGEEWGFENIEELYPRIMGKNDESIIKLLYENYGTEKDCRAFYVERMKRTMTLFDEGIPLRPGCMEILSFAKENKIPVAVATSTIMQIAERNLRKTGIWDLIDVVVTGDMVERSKPAPDIFLEAGRRIGANKDECIVCEDSYNGIIAAHASGMKPVFIPDMIPPTEETDKLAYKMCRDLFEVIDLIKTENHLI